MDIEKYVANENPNFGCLKCYSNNLWYFVDETFDGAYDRYNYYCHSCGYKWRIVNELD